MPAMPGTIGAEMDGSGRELVALSSRMSVRDGGLVSTCNAGSCDRTDDWLAAHRVQGRTRACLLTVYRPGSGSSFASATPSQTPRTSTCDTSPSIASYHRSSGHQYCGSAQHGLDHSSRLDVGPLLDARPNHCPRRSYSSAPKSYAGAM